MVLPLVPRCATAEAMPLTTRDAPQAERRVHEKRQRGQQASVANELPRLPTLRRESVFLTENYRRMVAMKRVDMHRRDAQAVVLQVFPKPEEDTVHRFGAETKLAERQERQRQWLAIMAAVAFVSVQEKAAQMKAMATLRRLLAPMIRNVRNKLRLRRRTALVLAVAQRDMQPITVEDLKANCPLVSWWDSNALAELQSLLVPAVALDNVLLVPPGGAKEMDFCVIDQGSVQFVVNPHDAVHYGVAAQIATKEFNGGQTAEEYARRRLQCTLRKQVGLLAPECAAVLTVSNRCNAFTSLHYAVEGTSPLGCRASGRLLYWRAAHDVFANLLRRQVARRPERALVAGNVIREAFIPVLYPPTLHALQNCNRNTMLSEWDERDIDDLRRLLQPVSREAGFVFCEPGDVASDFFFIASGLVEVLAPRNAIGPHTQLSPPDRSSNSVGRGAGRDEEPASHQAPLRRGVSFLEQTTSSRVTWSVDSDGGHDNDTSPGRATTATTGSDNDDWVPVTRLGPWSVVGLEGAVTMDRRTSRIRAITHVDVWTCRAKDVLPLLLANAALFLKLIRAVQNVKTQRMRTDVLIAALELDPVFADLPRQALVAIAAAAKPRWIPTHDVLRVLEGSAATSLLYATKGACRTVTTKSTASNANAHISLSNSATLEESGGDGNSPTKLSPSRLRGATSRNLSSSMMDLYATAGGASGRLMGAHHSAPLAINVPGALTPNSGLNGLLASGGLVATSPMELWELSAPAVVAALEAAHAELTGIAAAAARAKSPQAVPTSHVSTPRPPSNLLRRTPAAPVTARPASKAATRPRDDANVTARSALSTTAGVALSSPRSNRLVSIIDAISSPAAQPSPQPQLHDSRTTGKSFVLRMREAAARELRRTDRGEVHALVVAHAAAFLPNSINLERTLRV
jgi:CRP-like cAMP-binding protein